MPPTVNDPVVDMFPVAFATVNAPSTLIPPLRLASPEAVTLLSMSTTPVPLGFSSKFSLDLVVKISLPLILIPEVAILVVATLVNVGVALAAILMSLVFSVNVIPEPSVKVLNLRSIPTAFEKTFFPLPKFVIVLMLPLAAPGFAAAINLDTDASKVNTKLFDVVPSVTSLSSLRLVA